MTEQFYPNFNPYKPKVLVVGIAKNAASDQGFNCLLTERTFKRGYYMVLEINM